MNNDKKQNFTTSWKDLSLRVKATVMKSKNNEQALINVKRVVNDFSKLFTKADSFENIWLRTTFLGRDEAKNKFLDSFNNIELPQLKDKPSPIIYIVLASIMLILSIILIGQILHPFWKALVAIVIINAITINILINIVNNQKEKFHKEQLKHYMKEFDNNLTKFEQIINYDE